MPFSLKSVLVLFLAITLSACGFQLRGTGGEVLAVDQVRVVGSEQELVDQLEEILESIGIAVDGPNEPEYVVNIAGESLNRRAVASSGDITVSEYEVQLRAVFSISSATGEVVIPSSEVRAERVYSFDATNLVSNNEEEALLINEMRQDVASQLVRRFSATLRRLNAGEADSTP